MNKQQDYECNNTDKQGKRSTDCNIDIDSRYERYQEYLALKNLPFWSKRQALRYSRLKDLRKRDNVFAFKNAIE